MAKYEWQMGVARAIAAQKKVDAQTFKETLDEIQKTGLITPHAVVDAARDQSSPIHPLFTWDNNKAGESWRRQEARQFITACVPVTKNETKRVEQSYVHVEAQRDDKGKMVTKQCYMKVADAVRIPSVRENIIRECRENLDSWQRKYEAFSCIADEVKKVGEFAKTTLPNLQEASGT